MKLYSTCWTAATVTLLCICFVDARAYLKADETNNSGDQAWYSGYGKRTSDKILKLYKLLSKAHDKKSIADQAWFSGYGKRNPTDQAWYSGYGKRNPTDQAWYSGYGKRFWNNKDFTNGKRYTEADQAWFSGYGKRSMKQSEGSTST